MKNTGEKTQITEVIVTEVILRSKHRGKNSDY
jgi:hypothetical protein